jgi:hypothetical protein
LTGCFREHGIADWEVESTIEALAVALEDGFPPALPVLKKDFRYVDITERVATSLSALKGCDLVIMRSEGYGTVMTSQSPAAVSRPAPVS